MLGGGRAEAYMRDIYRTFVTSPENRARFAATLREIADGGRGPLLYHCTSGKDRTGWLSYVLLRALAVPEDSRSATTWPPTPSGARTTPRCGRA